jgi:hypothetical protein
VSCSFVGGQPFNSKGVDVDEYASPLGDREPGTVEARCPCDAEDTTELRTERVICDLKSEISDYRK